MYKKSSLRIISSNITSKHYRVDHDNFFVLFDGDYLGWCFYADCDDGVAHIYATDQQGQQLGQMGDDTTPLVYILSGIVEIFEKD